MEAKQKEKPGRSENRDETLTPLAFQLKYCKAGHSFIYDCTQQFALGRAHYFGRTITTQVVLVVNPATCETVRSIRIIILK